MRIIRFLDSLNQTHFGVLPPSSQDGELSDPKTAFRIEGDILGNFTVTRQQVAVAKLLAPVVPPAILCIGLNYRKHAEETNAKIPEFPILFVKNPAAVNDPGQAIQIPTHLASSKVDWEVELAVVIGKRAKNVAPENAIEHVLGFTIANDVSARDWQKDFGGSQWCRGKSFDTFCPLGPCVVTPDEISPGRLALRTTVNGRTVQSSSTADMIFPVEKIIAFLSGSTTLLPGTVILTGTPEGVGMGMKPERYLKAGDTVACTIEKIGTLSNPVTLEA